MKTNIFWFAMAAAAMLTGSVMFTSCNKDDDFGVPEVVESEVLDEGVAAEVTEEVGTEGTQLSYESWIVVKGQTRAAFENKISVTLNNMLNNVSQEIEVESWESGEAKISYAFESADSRKNGDFVTITDSVMICTVSYPNFAFDYELLYQVAVYDDGVTRQIMPYHKYENIVDNGCSLYDLEDVVENGVTYKRKLCSHSITVTFNKKEYTVSSEVVLKKAQKGEDKLLASKVVDEGLDFTVLGKWSGKSVSWILIEQTWSESGVKQVRKEITLNNEQLETTGYAVGVLNQMLGKDDFEYTAKVTAQDVELDSYTVDEFTVTKYSYQFEVGLKIKANGSALSYSPYELTYEKAVYKDEFLTYEMPAYEFEAPQTSHEVGEWQFVENVAYFLTVKTYLKQSFGEHVYENNGESMFSYEEE